MCFDNVITGERVLDQYVTDKLFMTVARADYIARKMVEARNNVRAMRELEWQHLCENVAAITLQVKLLHHVTVCCALTNRVV